MSAAIMENVLPPRHLEPETSTDHSPAPSSVTSSDTSRTSIGSTGNAKSFSRENDRPSHIYVAFGVLTFLRTFEEQGIVYGGDSNWIDLEPSNLCETTLESSLGDELWTLLTSGVIRVSLPVISGSRISLGKRHGQDEPYQKNIHDGEAYEGANGESNCLTTTVRVYVLPTHLHTNAAHTPSPFKSRFQSLLQRLDISTESWNAQRQLESHSINENGILRPLARFDPWASPQTESLFYLFNTLNSPKPVPESIKDRTSQLAAQRILDLDDSLFGLRSQLYPFQARSAALMIERETCQNLQLDPRLETRVGPDGGKFFYDPRSVSIYKHSRYYESYRGGILAESMGLGKTLICLTVILATRGHMPKIPLAYQDPIPVREKVASLKMMVSDSIVRHSVPWRAIVRDTEEQEDLTLSTCTNMLEKIIPGYSYVEESARFNRKTTQLPPKRIRMCGGTILVVPSNLIHQWLSEIKKHLHEEALSVLVVDDSRYQTPSAEALVKYDLIIFTKQRFEMEARDGLDAQGRRISKGNEVTCQCSYIGASRNRDCACVTTSDIYVSPLKSLHWLRIIVDEGHGFASTNTNAAIVAEKIVKAERRWIVSGTPAKDLVGVEIDLAAGESAGLAVDAKNQSSALEQRQKFNRSEDTVGAIKSLGMLVSHFLEVHPWHTSREEGKAEWEDYIYRHEDFKKRTYSSFSVCLKNTLQSLVIKTRPEDVDKDIKLPPFSHRVVYLEPSYYDKMTANMFIQVLRANAITSERRDVDYLFHKNNQKPRHDLIRNLQQSCVSWTGFTEEDVRNTVTTSIKYLIKANTLCSEEDRDLLLESVACAESVLQSPGWRALSRSKEIGIFLKEFPMSARKVWSLSDGGEPLMVGLTQLLEAQALMNGHVNDDSPVKKLKDLGETIMRQTLSEKTGEHVTSNLADGTEISRSGVPASCLAGQVTMKLPRVRVSKGLSTSKAQTSKRTKKSDAKPKANNRTKRSLIVVLPATPKKRTLLEGEDALPTYIPPEVTRIKRVRFNSAQDENEVSSAIPPVSQELLVSTLEGGHMTEIDQPQTESMTSPGSASAEIPEEDDESSDWQHTRIIGTTSAKFSYIIEKVMRHHREEKILIFYDGDNTAFYLAQFLELMHIKHLIYANSLDNARRSRYVSVFNEDPSVRVFFIDVRCGALGLNLNAASLVVLINPINRPHIEAQAIKRAHRIGQTRPVHVETLILKGSIEEAVFQRAKAMTKKEHSDAKVLEDDDQIKGIIQQAKIIPVLSREAFGVAQMAPLEIAQLVFNRPDRSDTLISGIDRDTKLKPKKSIPAR